MRYVEPRSDARTKLAAFFTILLWKNDDDTDWSPRPAGDFHRQSQQGATRRRNLIKPRHIFEAIEARTVQYSMDRKILRWTMVDAGRVDADSMNASFSHQKTRQLPVRTRENEASLEDRAWSCRNSARDLSNRPPQPVSIMTTAPVGMVPYRASQR